MTTREIAKTLARLAALVVVSPLLASHALRCRVTGPYQAIESSSQTLSLIPGLTGDYLRRAFLARTLAHVSPSATVQFGTIFSQPGAHLGDNVYVGPRCHLGLVHLERDVLVAAGVHIPSGGATHDFSDPTRPIREQGGRRSLVRIGEGSWIGSAAIVLADVGRHSVVAAGAVVTRPVPDYVVVAGVPARIVRERTPVMPG